MNIKERPILFSGEMVRAILAGNKTQTRRVVKFPKSIKDSGVGNHNDIFVDFLQEGQIDIPIQDGFYAFLKHDSDKPSTLLKCPYGQPGDRLWVREVFLHELEGCVYPSGEWVGSWKHHGKIAYVADGAVPQWANPERQHGWMAKRPSIHMPRWASRILLEVKAVRVEQLQDISEEDAKKEGVQASTRQIAKYGRGMYVITAKQEFAALWDSINGKRPGHSWNDNPWVWVVEFEVIEPTRQTAE